MQGYLHVVHEKSSVSCMTSGSFCQKLRYVAHKWGKLIEEAREAAKWSQAELADRTGIDPSLISRYEAGGTGRLPVDRFNRLTQALRSLSPVELLEAMGYEIRVPGAERLPRELVRDLLGLPKEDLEAVARLVSRRGHPPDKPEGRQ